MHIRYENTGIEVDLLSQGKDLLIRIYGGAAHIGAVAVAEPRASLSDKRTGSATVSVINYCGHKDDSIAVPVAKLVCSALQVKVVVVCGIHFDNIDPVHLADIESMPETISTDLLKALEHTNSPS